MAIIIPEIILINIVDSLLNKVKVDFEENQNNNTPTQSLLYCYFNGLTHYKKDYYIEAVDLFTREVGHPRIIDTRLFFDAGRAIIPTIHITMPSDQTGQNSLSFGESGSHVKAREDGSYSNIYERRFDSQYQIVCTSDNHSEVLLMYHLLRAGMISVSDTISFEGLENLKISGQELKINPEIAPNHIFMRSLSVTFSYNVEVPVWWTNDLIQEICIGDATINKI